MVILCCGRSEVNVEQVQEPTPELLYFIRIEREWTWDGLQEVSSKSVKNLGEWQTKYDASTAVYLRECWRIYKNFTSDLSLCSSYSWNTNSEHKANPED